MRVVGAVLLGILGGVVMALALVRFVDLLAIRMAANPYSVFLVLWLPIVASTIAAFFASAIATSVAKRGPAVGVISGLFVSLVFWVVTLPFPLWMAVTGLALQLIAAFAAAWLFGRAQLGLRMRWGVIIALITVAAIGAGTAWWRGYFPTRVDDLTFVSLERFHADGERDNLHLRFRSDHNLRRLTERSGAFGAYANISLCPFHDNPSVGIGRVRHNGVDLDTKPGRACEWHGGIFAGCRTYDDTPEVRAEAASTVQGPFFYDVYFTYYEQWVTYKNLGTTQRRIPLPSAPQDLCVKIYGDGGPPGLQSNEFVIPKSALARALGDTPIPPVTPTVWRSDPQQLSCEPHIRKLGEPVHLSLGPEHGGELAIHRLSDDAWFMLVTSSPPVELHPLTTPREYSKATQLELPANVKGYKWWSADGHLEQVFSLAGGYVIYSSELESDQPGLGCLVTLTKP